MRLGAIIIIAELVVFATLARAELIHGTANLDWSPFDFSEFTYATDICLADVYLGNVDPPGCEAVMGCWVGTCSNEEFSVIAIIVGKTLDEVDEAPEDSSLYDCGDCAGRNFVYAVHTADGLYAKFAFSDWPDDQPFPNSWTIDYYVQTDGSRNLDTTVPTEGSTWGRIKALYNK